MSKEILTYLGAWYRQPNPTTGYWQIYTRSPKISFLRSHKITGRRFIPYFYEFNSNIYGAATNISNGTMHVEIVDIIGFCPLLVSTPENAHFNLIKHSLSRQYPANLISFDIL